MSAAGFDDPALRSAMADYVSCAHQLDESSSIGADARTLLDLAEAKTLAGLRLRKRLLELGWVAPVVEPARR